MNQEKFLLKYKVKEKFTKCNISWDELMRIYEDYIEKISQLKNGAFFITEQLREIDKVHSIKYRIKDPEHLIEKIIRKNSGDNSYKVTIENYLEKITDLIGVRVLHLFKEDWEIIHDEIMSTWDLREEPTANIRTGDNDIIKHNFEQKGCRINEHEAGYRSVHYLIKTQPGKFNVIAEIQVRTIFEEGWSEIDHKVRYPYNVDNQILCQYLEVFNRISGTADEMASFLLFLNNQISNYERIKEEKNSIETELANTINNLKIEQKEKTKLLKQIEDYKDKYERSTFLSNYNLTSIQETDIQVNGHTCIPYQNNENTNQIFSNKKNIPYISLGELSNNSEYVLSPLTNETKDIIGTRNKLDITTNTGLKSNCTLCGKKIYGTIIDNICLDCRLQTIISNK